MFKNNGAFHSAEGKRQVLIADDEQVNREILQEVFEDEFELIFATNGQETLDAMYARRDTLALVLLDLMMPVVSGKEVLERAKDVPDLAGIPIIVLTSDQEAEVESLTLGAIDFIPKPYPSPSVIRARVHRIIELSDDRKLISSTERDELTGLYNREYFYRYAEQYDKHHKNNPMDAIMVDVNHFHMVNERFGNAYGDRLLKRIGEVLRSLANPAGGIVCRRSADTFMVYCPHGLNYEEMLEKASVGISDNDSYGNRIWLRMGVYPNVDKSLQMERRFDRAKMAADSVHGSFTNRIGMYDDALHDKELYAEQLIEGFQTAVQERQFKVYYQPKFDVQSEPPRLASAEALVRWQHPELGLIPPNVFIPLFEQNGLVQELDAYVWNETADQIRDWRNRLGFSVPVSVNVSRVDMYDPRMVDTLLEALDRNDLQPVDLLLEVTESAYTQDTDQIVDTVNILRGLGFRVEMDDFGTGYSSLNMVSTMPIDALKLDMSFIRNAFNEQRDTKMVEVIIDIADYLDVPVIAEGVETQEQMAALRDIGCDYVQGYFFSRPVPVDEFDQFIEKDKDAEIGQVSYKKVAPKVKSALRESSFGEIANALSSGFDIVYYVDVESAFYVKFIPQDGGTSLHVEKRGVNFFEDMRQHVLREVFTEDRARVEAALEREALAQHLVDGKSVFASYRIVSSGSPEYRMLKAARAQARDDRHVVIGVSNMHEQMRRDQERDGVLSMAKIDALTGVKSRFAFEEVMRKYDLAISDGTQGPFGIVLCAVLAPGAEGQPADQAAEEERIKRVCRSVCTIFDHSPVFRIEDHEFVALLAGSDYENRIELKAQLDDSICDEAEGTIATCGLSEYDAGEDSSSEAVLGRAWSIAIELMNN